MSVLSMMCIVSDESHLLHSLNLSGAPGDESEENLHPEGRL